MNDLGFVNNMENGHADGSASITSPHTVWIPPVHRDLTGGVERVQIAAATVGDVVAALDARFPGMAARLTLDGALRPGIAVAVDGVIATRGLRQRLTTPSELHFVPAMAGG